jgi:hypothetical protein
VKIAMRRLVLSFMVGCTILALAAGMALAQATTDTFTHKAQLDTILTNPCTGEPLHLTGNVRFLFHTTEDAKGGLHVQFKFQSQGVSATGLESGEQYRGVFVQRDGAYFPPGDLRREFTTVYRTLLVSQGPSANLVEIITFHVTINANGEPTAEVSRVDLKCAG